MLVTGTRSGLGRAIHEALGGDALVRENAEEVIARLKRTGTDVIVHCAFRPVRDAGMDELPGYMKDSVELTQRLVAIPHQKFILISSCDVYPRDGKVHSENSPVDESPSLGLYPKLKIMTETALKAVSADALILRPTLLLGKYSRPNNLSRLMGDESPVLSLTEDSDFNIVLHEDVIEFVKKALATDLKGIYNLSSSSAVRISDIASNLGKKPKYGSFRYQTPSVSNRKACAVLPALAGSSLDALKRFLHA